MAAIAEAAQCAASMQQVAGEKVPASMHGDRSSARCVRARRGRQLRVGMGAAQTTEAVGGRSWLGAGRPRLTDGRLIHAGRVGARLGHRRALDSPAERWAAVRALKLDDDG